MKNSKLIYIFQNGRKDRLNNKEFPKEFFYGYQWVSKKFKNSEIIEFSKNRNSKVVYSISRMLEKLSGLPFFLDKIMKKENYKKFKDADLIIMTNQRVAFSSFPYLILNKMTKKSKTGVFIMGLFDVVHKNIIKNTLRRINIYIFMKLADKLLFLSLGEYEFVSRSHKKFKNKIEFLPFPVDTKFWESSQKLLDNKNILFIGNDGKRDYEFVIELAKEMQDYKFTFITSKILKEQIKYPNIKLINGDWGQEILSDIEIRDFYHDSFLTLIPLNKSLQPSGQSVALQSISCGTPVLITETDGFWQPELFKHKKNILFMKENNISAWKELINECASDKDLYNDLIKNGKETIIKNYQLDEFNLKLEKIFF